jgi:biotin carboxyl carrier protein
MPEEVKAHITGVVFQLTSQVGDTLAAGDPVIVLESMKMEIPCRGAAGGCRQGDHGDRRPDGAGR